MDTLLIVLVVVLLLGGGGWETLVGAGSGPLARLPADRPPDRLSDEGRSPRVAAGTGMVALEFVPVPRAFQPSAPEH